MSRPLVSVVVPFFNAERFLRETIDSVFAQTFTDWELILVDDGSTDGSSAVARATVQSSPHRVAYVEHARHENLGLSSSRNAGCERARSEWIALFDADDVWLPHKLERQLIIGEQHPAAQVIFGRAQYWHSWDHGRDVVPQFDALSGSYQPPRLLLATILGATAPPPPSDVLVRRELWKRVGGFEREFPGMYEDQVFLAKCMANAPGYVAPETWTRYRRHAQSLEAVMTGDVAFTYSERMRFLRWLAGTFGRHPDPAVRKAVESFTWPARHPHLHRWLWRTRQVLSPSGARRSKTSRNAGVALTPRQR